MGAFIVYLLAIVASSAVLVLSGFDTGTWQYWVILFAMIASHISGREWKRER